jgi:glycerophosphoryl diester phosphodiesterase
MLTYTNSKEAVELNYVKGHRVFEIDFNLTSDNCLAAVHDWEHGASITGSRFSDDIPTLEEWKRKKIFGKYTTMDINDVVELMNVYKDIFIVTDTNSTNPGTVLAEFKEIYNAAEKVDLQIMNRIVPQIYHPEMLGVVKSVYDFPSIIYTLYQSPQTDDEVLEFIKDNEDIHVLTMRPERASVMFIENLTSLNKLVYCHTINKFNEAAALLNNNVYGLYTDYLY